jgi:hypothetical protein
MLAVPLAKLGVGVKVPDLVIPAPLRALSEPPEIAKSPVAPFQLKLDPGSSENLKVIAAVSSDLSVDTSDVIVTVGANVSIVMEGELPAEPVLPAES